MKHGEMTVHEGIMWVRNGLGFFPRRAAMALACAASAIVLPLELPSLAAAGADSNALPLLTTARQLMDLSAAEAARHYPLQLRGTVSYWDRNTRTLFALDETSGFWVYPHWPEPSDFQFGQVIELTGVSEGPNVSAVWPATIRVVGTAPLPAPMPVTYERMAGGSIDCQWVELEGVVRAMSYHHGLLRFLFVTGSQRVPLFFPDYGDKPLPTHLMGAHVRVHGVVSMRVTSDRHVTGSHLFVQNLDSITVLKPAPTDAFDARLHAVEAMSTYGTQVEFGEPVRVAGVVTLWRPSGELYIRDNASPLAIRLRQPWVKDDPLGRYVDPAPALPLKPGDRVEVVGYPTLAAPAMALEDAEYRLVGATTNLPAPVRATPEAAAQAALHGELIQLEGYVLAHGSLVGETTASEVLSIQCTQHVFEAELVTAKPVQLAVKPRKLAARPGQPAAKPVQLAASKGAFVRISGIDSVQPDTWNRPHSFRLLLRSPDDVAILKPPPLLTLRIAARLGGVAAGLILLGAMWIFVLRRRVAARTASLRLANEHLQREIDERQQAEFGLRRAQKELRAALDKERELHELKSNFVNLVSHEFRTPLSIILSSAEILSSYLPVLKAEQRAIHLKDIKESTCYMADLVEDVLMLGRVEAGKIQFAPAPLNVAQFCRRLVDEVCSAANQRCPIELTTDSGEDSATGDEALLRHILMNLLSNAVKYSPAGRPVSFSVERVRQDALFVVRDQGIGIPAEDLKRLFSAFHRGSNVGQLPGTGLGLFIVHRCVELHHGHINISSVEGVGTTVTVRVPLYAATDGSTSTPHAAAAMNV
jgi:signal transduction histidine kinase